MADSWSLSPPDRIFQDTPFLPNPYVCSRQKEIDGMPGTTSEPSHDPQLTIEERAFEGWGYDGIRRAIQHEEIRKELFQDGVEPSANRLPSQLPRDPTPMDNFTISTSNISSSEWRRSALQAESWGGILHAGYPAVPQYPYSAIQVEAPYPNLYPGIPLETTLELSRRLSRYAPFTCNFTPRIPRPPLSQVFSPQMGQVPLAFGQSQAVYPIPRGLDQWIEDPVRQATLRYYDRRIVDLKLWLWKAFWEASGELDSPFLETQLESSWTLREPISEELALSGVEPKSVPVTSEDQKVEDSLTLLNPSLVSPAPNPVARPSEDQNVKDETLHGQRSTQRHTIRVDLYTKEEYRKRLAALDTRYHDYFEGTSDEQKTDLRSDLPVRRSSIDSYLPILRIRVLDDSNPKENHSENSQEQHDQAVQEVLQEVALPSDPACLNNAPSEIANNSVKEAAEALILLSLRGGFFDGSNPGERVNSECPEQDSRATQEASQGMVPLSDPCYGIDVLVEMNDCKKDVITAAYDATSSKGKASLDSIDRSLYRLMEEEEGHSRNASNNVPFQPRHGKRQTASESDKSQVRDPEGSRSSNGAPGEDIEASPSEFETWSTCCLH